MPSAQPSNTNKTRKIASFVYWKNPHLTHVTHSWSLSKFVALLPGLPAVSFGQQKSKTRATTREGAWNTRVQKNLPTGKKPFQNNSVQAFKIFRCSELREKASIPFERGGAGERELAGEFAFVYTFERDLGPVSRKPRKLFRPVKQFLVHLYLKTEKCIRLKLLVWREYLFIIRTRE